VSRLRLVLAFSLLPLAALAQSAIPEPDVTSLGATFLAALSGKQYPLLASVVLLGAVWLLRAVGGRFIPALATPRGGAILSAVGGTAALLVAALSSGQPLSVGLVLGCLSTALGASGLWSTAKNVAKGPTQQKVCDPVDIANRTCVP
jgi:hypothetical protein